MKRIVTGVLTGFMFLVVASQASYAQQCGGPMGEGGRPWMMHHGGGMRYGSPEAKRYLWHKLMGLGLSDQQKDALKALRSRVERDMIKKRADLELAQLDLREFLHQDKVDMKAVESSLKKVEGIKTDIKLTYIKAWQEVKATLTPEQQKKLKEELKAGFMKHDKGYGGRHEKQMPPPPTSGK
jgi:Spy/CpxP family protein refolding chaperone